MRVVLIVMILAVAAGCATEQSRYPARAPTAAAPGINLTGYTPAFRSGYADGCNSVNGPTRRDDTRFKSEADYAQGWRDGNDICKRRK